MKLGAVDATVHQGLAGQYGVRGYPTIKFFPAGIKGEAQEYDGGRTSDDIVKWALDRDLIQCCHVIRIMIHISLRSFLLLCTSFWI